MGSSPTQAASMLKDKAALFKRADDNLFGKEFREDLADSLKERKQENEVVSEISRGIMKPFSRDPLSEI